MHNDERYTEYSPYGLPIVISYLFLLKCTFKKTLHKRILHKITRLIRRYDENHLGNSQQFIDYAKCIYLINIGCNQHFPRNDAIWRRWSFHPGRSALNCAPFFSTKINSVTTKHKHVWRTKEVWSWTRSISIITCANFTWLLHNNCYVTLKQKKVCGWNFSVLLILDIEIAVFVVR